VPSAVMRILTGLGVVPSEALSALRDYAETPVQSNQAGSVGRIVPIFSVGGGV
jgi:hypothetical protein